ncbi:MAG: sulfatase [Bacteroidota bacterium]
MVSKKYLFIATLFLFMLGGGFSSRNSEQSSKEREPSPRPNIVLFVADDHGKDALGCYGNPVIQTPHLDELAKTATRMDRAFCTTASCSASRSVILSGKHNHANGQYGHQHAYHHFAAFKEIESLPVSLQKVGYRTAHIGKYHVASEQVFFFQERFKANSRSAVEMANSCKEFVSKDSPDPFFLYFCFSDPHRGGGFAEELPYQPDRFGNVPESYPGVEEVTYAIDEVIVPPFLPNTPETRAEIAQYYQSISRLDQGVGKLIEYLKNAGKYDNTLILYLSDNGMAFPGAKTTLYEAGMQLPCIIKMPGQKIPQTSDLLFSWTDLAPTVLDIADAMPKAAEYHGVSIKPALEGKKMTRTEVYASHTFHEITMYYPMRVIREGQYKLIMNIAHGLDYPFASDLQRSKTWQSVLENKLSTLGNKPLDEFLSRPQFELYDLEADPWETSNLAQDPAHTKTLERLMAKVKDFQQNTGDPWVYKWTYE